MRVVGRGLDVEQTTVSDIASGDIVALTPDDDLDDALSLMARAQVRRLPVVVREDELVGVVSQADVARSDAKEKHVAEVVEAISQPPRGPRVVGDADSESESTRRPDERRYDSEREPHRDRR